MRLVTYSVAAPSSAATRPAPGVETAAGILDLAAVLGPDSPTSVARFMGADAAVTERVRVAAAAAEADPDQATAAGLLHPVAGLRRHAPLGERVLMVCAGANYHSHLEEMGGEPSRELAWFVQNPNSIIGTGDPVQLPAHVPDTIDFEGELCVVFGRRAHAVRAEDAMSYVGGYTVYDDISDRTAIPGLDAASTPEEGRYAWTNMLMGKQYPTFAPMGPAVVTADEVVDPDKLHLTTTVNGVLMQDANTADLVVGIPELIERLSYYFVFEPGDVLSTGTPGGVGAGRTPPQYLRPGDVVEVSVDGVGTLSNPITMANPIDGGRR